jgi:hypothetical protein
MLLNNINIKHENSKDRLRNFSSSTSFKNFKYRTCQSTLSTLILNEKIKIRLKKKERNERQKVFLRFLVKLET